MSSFTSPDPALAHFAGIVLAAMLGAIQGRADRVGTFWQVAVRLPGTFLHELAHLVVALITGGKPAGFSINPRRTVGGSAHRVWVLGSVTITNPSIIAAFPSGFAPLLLLPFAWFLYRRWFVWFPSDLPHTLLMYVAIVICCGNSLPSAQDVAVAFSRPLGVILYAAVGAGAWFIWYTLRG